MRVGLKYSEPIWRSAKLAKTRNHSQLAAVSWVMHTSLLSGMGWVWQLFKNAAMLPFVSSVWFYPVSDNVIASHRHTNIEEDVGLEGNSKAQRAHLDHALVLGLGRAPVLCARGVCPIREAAHPPLHAGIRSSAEE